MKDFSVALIKSEFRVDSRLLSPELNHRHRTILENIDKYNLMNTENTTVAWVEISNFNGRQTSVEFYYAPHAPDIHRSVTTIAERCS